MSFVQCQEEIALAQRVLGAKASATKEMTRLANQMRQQGQSVITLSQGEPDFATPEHVRQAAKEAIDRNESRYTEVAGTLALREAVVRKFERDNGLHFSPDQIQVGCGAKQALYNALQATVQDGDEVIIPTPAWVSYPEMVLLAGGQPVIVRCSAQAGFKLQADQLERAITPRTKWLMLNSPSNPSGAVYSRQELEALEQVLLRHPHVWVMADDVYEKIRYSDEPFATPAALSPYMAARTLTINGVSKAYAMTGWRIGYAGGPAWLIKAMADLQSQSTSNPCSISQYAVLAALNGPQDFLRERNIAFRERRDLVVAMLNDAPGLSCPTPEGAFYVYPDATGVMGKTTPKGKKIETDADLIDYFLDEYRVAAVHGEAFGLSPGFRISYATSSDILKEACTRIQSACAALT